MIGETIGRYRIDAEVGRGGMGVVYRATQMTLDRTVAIKMLSPQLAGSHEHLARFRREAEVLARLQHENIVHIYDVEEVEGAFCIIMEYVAGPTLGELLAREGVLSPSAVRDVAVQLASGLDAAHRQGIVHRDLKPDNILFTSEGRPRITDFGIARIAGGDAMARTRTGILMGTPYYMSPEQAGGREVTGASDLYSLGVLLYQMLSGRVPFQGNDPISLAIKHIQAPVPPLDSTMPGLPGAMVRIVSRALEKEPHRRFGSAAEMGMALQTLDLDPVALPMPSFDEDAVGDVEPDPTACPECGCRVHSAFVTCPRCALPLRSGPGIDAGSMDPPAVSPVSAGPRIRLPWTGADWVQPRGRWGIPPILWAGVGIVAVGVAVGLLGGGGPGVGSGSPPLSGGGGGGSSVLPLQAEGPFARSGGAVPPSNWSPASAGGEGSEEAGGEPEAGSEEVPGPEAPTSADTPEPSGPEPSGPEPGVADPPETVDLNTADPQEPEVAFTHPTFSDTGGYENLPADFDIERARREIVGIVERQREATESGDAAEFARDLSPELALEAVDALLDLHGEFHSIRSELANLRIYFEDATRARVDFHTWLSGVPRGGGGREQISDIHLYWSLAHRDNRWVVIAVDAEMHDSEDES